MCETWYAEEEKSTSPTIVKLWVGQCTADCSPCQSARQKSTDSQQKKKADCNHASESSLQELKL